MISKSKNKKWGIVVVDDQGLEQNTGWQVCIDKLIRIGVFKKLKDTGFPMEINKAPENYFSPIIVKILTQVMFHSPKGKREVYTFSNVIERVQKEDFDIALIDLDLHELEGGTEGGGFRVWKEIVESHTKNILSVIYTGQVNLEKIIEDIDGYSKVNPLILKVGNEVKLKNAIQYFMRRKQLGIRDLCYKEVNGICKLQNDNFWERELRPNENEVWKIKDLFPFEYVEKKEKNVKQILLGRFVDLFRSLVSEVCINRELLSKVFKESQIDMENYFQKNGLSEVDRKVDHFFAGGENAHYRNSCEAKKISEGVIKFLQERFSNIGELETSLDPKNITINNLQEYIQKLLNSRNLKVKVNNLFFKNKGENFVNSIPQGLTNEDFFQQFPIYYKDLETIVGIARNNANKHSNGFKICGLIKKEGEILVMEIHCGEEEIDLLNASKRLHEIYNFQNHQDKITRIKYLVCKRYGGKFLFISKKKYIECVGESIEMRDNKKMGGVWYHIEIPKYT